MSRKDVDCAGLVAIGVAAGLVSSLTNSPVLAALAVYVVVFLLDIASGLEVVRDWTPITLVRADTMAGAWSLSHYLPVAGVTLAVLGILALVGATRPMRYPTTTSGPHTARSPLTELEEVS